MIVHGIRCTSPARNLVDIARDPRMAAHQLLVVQMIDGARRFERCSPDELRRTLHNAAGLRNVRRAREWVSLSCDGVDSPPETHVRLLLLDAGVKNVETDIRIYDDLGDNCLAQGDLGDRARLIWAEYDGYDTHTERKVFRGDRIGDRWLGRRGWHVIRIVDTDLADPRGFILDWKQAVADAPARIAALDPGRSPEVAAARRALRIDRA